MSAEILVSNLPSGTEASEIEALFREWGAEATVEIRDEGNPDSLTAVVKLDIEPKTARHLVDHAKGHFFKERKLEFYAPLLMGKE